MAQDNLDPSQLKVVQELASTLQKSNEYMQKMATAMTEMSKSVKDAGSAMKLMEDSVKKQLEGMAGITAESDKDTKKTQEKVTQRYALGKAVIEELAAVKELTDWQAKMVGSAQTMLDAEAKIAEIRAQNAKRNQEEESYAAKKKQALQDEAGLFKTIQLMWEERQKKKIEGNYEYNPETGKSEYKGGTGKLIANKVVGTLGEVTGGLAGAAQSLLGGNQFTQMLMGLGPIGALLGVMISGRIEDMKWDAVGQGVKQQFDRIGGATDGFAGRMGGAARALSVAAMASEKDLSAVAASFASTGIKAKEAEARIVGLAGSAAGVRLDNLMMATLSLDKLLEQAAGTTAKLVGEFAKLGNTSGREAFVALAGVGAKARDAGADMASFMSQTLEAASSLKLMNANAAQVGDLQLRLFNDAKRRGMNDGTAQDRAAAQAGGATRTVAGLGVGLSAYVGERVFGKQGLDAWYAMKSPEGRDGKQNADFDKIVAELAKLATDQTSNKAEQVRILMEATGADMPGAEAILKAGEMMRDGTGQLPKSLREAVQNGMRSEAEKTSAMERHLAAIKDIIAQIGSGLMAVAVNLLKGILHGIMGILNISIWDEKGKDTSKAYFNAAGADFSIAGGKMGEVASLGGKLLKRVGSMAADIMGPGAMDDWFLNDAQIQKYKDMDSTKIANLTANEKARIRNSMPKEDEASKKGGKGGKTPTGAKTEASGSAQNANGAVAEVAIKGEVIVKQPDTGRSYYDNMPAGV